MKPIILLVDDDEEDRLTFQRVIEGENINVYLNCAANAREAEACLRTTAGGGRDNRTGLVVLDLNIPGADGFQILRSMKSDPNTRSIPVVVFTTSSSRSDMRQCYEIGANSFIVKPVDLVDFKRVVRGLVDYWFGLVETG